LSPGSYQGHTYTVNNLHTGWTSRALCWSLPVVREQPTHAMTKTSIMY